MNNWKNWIAVIGILLLMRMCGGCLGCSGKDVRGETIYELKDIIKESGTITEDEAKVLVANHIMSNMNNPDSYEAVDWGPLKESAARPGLFEGGWSIRHKYRGQNGFGGTITEESTFFISKDGSVM